MAQRLWPGKDPIGHQFKRLDDPDHVMTVIGVMKTAQMNELVEAPGSYFLIPLTQNYVARQLLIVRTSGAPLAITQPVLQCSFKDSREFGTAYSAAVLVSWPPHARAAQPPRL
jgi:hypothetical protein